jgi:hypothetical protein
MRALLNKAIGPSELIVILDSCTDRSEEIIDSVVDEYKSYRSQYANQTGKFGIVKFQKFIGQDLFEVKANNLGMRHAVGENFLVIQDDMVVEDFGYDKILLSALLQNPDLLSVSGRCAHNVYWDQEIQDFTWPEKIGHCTHHDYKVDPADRDAIHIRDVAIRAPLLINGPKMKELKYFDENFYPFELDDHGKSRRCEKVGAGNLC